ncbi:phytanoyl-CoA dioxygenase domain-containing protein 1-like isoform X2 [Physella acuta]|uniref:phytanoyl-CoA dioxygenase domain-containing protein 1-like isoform X2 n=1 Tax=Physella acuta TaxID=109671 RepID=UPI0027DBFA1A|nr:phytanoyl-CoA dioxygenase domain-containing protein 1-like isoform X2 [Physella acuta]
MPVPGLVPDARPELFDIRAMPEQPKILKPGQLEESLIREFFEKGYLLVPKFFTEEELEPCRKSIEKLVDDLAQALYDGGKIKNLYKEQGLFQRLIYLEKEFPGANIILHKQGTLTEAFQNVWSNERLLNVVEQLVGPEIMGHPVWNLRTKTPQNEATTVPWHQDSAYLDNESYGVLQATAWIPLLDATEKNGCMEVISGGHLAGKVARHTCCWGDTWYVETDVEHAEKTLNVDFVKDKVLCPVPYGGMLLINNMIPHRSLNNCSDEIRWSLDLRWQNPEKPVGFYGLKQGVLMRSEKNPVEKIDWDSFNSVDRHIQADINCKVIVEEDPFDTTIVGPWMQKWEMTHTNRHTEKLASRGDTSWHKA